MTHHYQSKITSKMAVDPGPGRCLGSFGDLGPGEAAAAEWQALITEAGVELLSTCPLAMNF